MRRAILVATILLAGCDLDAFGPEVEFTNRRPLVPVPTHYATLYAATEQCLGQAGAFAAVRWLVADEIRFEGRDVVALTQGDDITMRTDRTDSDMHVRHESAHHITGVGEELHIPGTNWVRCDGVH